MPSVVMIPADKENKLFLKDLREGKDSRLFLKYRSTYNDIPFMETEVFPADGGANCVITGEDGTVLFRFPTALLGKLDVVTEQ